MHFHAVRIVSGVGNCVKRISIWEGQETSVIAAVYQQSLLGDSEYPADFLLADASDSRHNNASGCAYTGVRRGDSASPHATVILPRSRTNRHRPLT